MRVYDLEVGRERFKLLAIGNPISADKIGLLRSALLAVERAGELDADKCLYYPGTAQRYIL